MNVHRFPLLLSLDLPATVFNPVFPSSTKVSCYLSGKKVMKEYIKKSFPSFPSPGPRLVFIVPVRAAVRRTSASLLPPPLVVVVVCVERAGPDAPSPPLPRAPLRLVAIVQGSLRSQPRFELSFRVVVVGSLPQPVRFVLIQMGHGPVVPVA